MENLNVVRAQISYEQLRVRRDDALEHFKNCVIRHDDDASHFWAGILKSIEYDMKKIHIGISKQLEVENAGD